MAQFPNSTTADGIWTLKKVRRAILGDNWPSIIETDAFWANTVLLLNGENAFNGGQNNTFLDTSTNGHSITRNGNVTQGSFSPFSADDGKWGIYCLGGFVKTNNNITLGTNDFTIEFWVYPNDLNSSVLWSDWRTSTIQAVPTIYSGNGTLYYYVNGGAVITAPTSLVTNQWQHIAVERVSGTTTLYLDGVSQGTYADSINYIGANAAFGGYIISPSSFRTNGYMSNARVVNGSAVYNGAFTPPTAPLTNVTNTAVLTCQSNQFVDSSGNYSIVITDSPEVAPFSPFPQTTAYTPSVVNQGSVRFDGTDDKLTISSDSSLQLGSESNWTIEMWVQLVATPTNFDVILGKGNSGTFEYFIEGFSDRTIDFLYSNNGSPWAGQHQITPAMTLGEWFHLAVVRDGASLKSYVNGVEYFSGSAGDIYVGSGLLGVGGYAYAAQDPNVILSNVRIVKGTSVYTADFTVPTEPLTAITNTSLLTCQDGAFRDNSSNAHAITVNGDPEITTFVPFGERSVEFDGTAGQVLTSETGQSFGTGEFTVEAWVYPDNYSDFRGIFATENYNTNNQLSLRASQTSGQLVTFLGNGFDLFSSSKNIKTNQWSHVALTRDSGGTARLFLNGEQVGSANWSGKNITGTNYQVGNYRTDSGFSYEWDGYLSNVRAVVGTALYTADFTPPQEPLTAITNTSLLTCQNAVFQDNSGNAHAITANGDPQASTNLPFGERSVYFDGSGDGLSTSVGTSFNVGSGDFTIESFGYLTTAGQFNNIVSAGVDASNGYRLDISTSNNLRLLAYIGGSWSTVITGSTALTTGKWYHLAVTRSGNDFDLWIDGVSDATTVTNSGTIGDPTAKIEVGAVTTNSLNRSFYGYLSNTRLVKGTAVYTAAFTPPTEPLTAVSGTSLLTCQDAVFQDNSGNAHAITVNGNAKATTNIPFDAVTYGVEQYLDDAYTVSPQGGSGYFEQDDYVAVADDTSFDVSGAYTAEAWIYVDTFPSGNVGATGQGFVMSRWDANSNQRSWGIFLGNNGGISLYHSATGSATYTSANAPAGTITGSAWHHVAATWDGTTMRLFVDGTVVASTADASGPYSTPNAGVALNSLNVSLTGTGIKQYISNARYLPNEALYTANFTPSTSPLTAVTNTEFLCNFTNASIVDATGRNVIETVGNAQVDTTTVKYGTGAMEFDGTGDYLVSPASEQLKMSTGDYTVEAWVYASNSNGVNKTIWTTNWGANGSLLFTYDHPSVGAKKFGLFDHTFNAGTPLLTSSSTFEPNEWHHVAVVRSGTTAKIYVNGTEEASATQSTDLTRNVFGVGSVYTTSATQTWAGYLDDFRITKGIARYTADFTPPTKELPVVGE